jgi:ribosomal protein S17E
MKVKGTVVKSIQQFVKDKWSNQFNDWINNLPLASKNIMNNAIYATDWYPIDEAVIQPTYHLKMFFDDNSLKAAIESGKYSAEATLTGVYKIFVKFANPGYIIKRASKIMGTHYEDAILDVGETTNKSVVLFIKKFDKIDKMIEYRIAGWIEKGLELSGCNDIIVRVIKSLTKGDDVTEYKMTWR